MHEHQGFYSVIQYMPVPERFEFLNIGVVLFTPNSRQVEVKIAPDHSRISRLFGQRARGKIKLLSDSLVSRLHTEFGSGWKRESLEKVCGLAVANMRMSQPLPILIKENPKALLDSLFDEMVGRPASRQRSVEAASRFRQQLIQAGVLDLVDQSPPEVDLPQGVTIKVPYAYQNGAYNLIDPVRLEGPPEEALKNASSRAFEGRWLWDYSNRSKRLIVVGDLSSQPDAFANSLQSVMKDNNVKFYEMNEVDELLADIRRHGPAASEAGLS